MPLIIRRPGTTPNGDICHEPVLACDLYPTLLSMLGCEADRLCDKLCAWRTSVDAQLASPHPEQSPSR